MGIKPTMISLNRTILSLLGFGAILQLNPYFVWHTNIFLLYSFCIFVFCIFYFIKNNSIKFNNLLMLVFFLLVMLVFSFSSSGFILYLNSSVMLVFGFILISNKDKLKVYSVFYNLYALSLLPGLVVIVLSLFGFDLFWEAIDPPSSSKESLDLYYRKYIGSVALSNQIISSGLQEFYRFSAMYEEPGVVGTVSGLLLASRNFDLKLISSKIIFVGGCISFSLAFYVIAILYLLLKRPVFIGKLSILVMIFSLFFYTELTNNVLYKKFIIDRVDLIFENPEAANNRVDACFDSEFKSFLEKDNFLIGKGSGAHTKHGCNSSSYLSLIYNHGFLGFTLIIFFYIFLYFSLGANFKKLLYLYPFLLVFMISIFQRPAVFSIWMIIIFSAAIINENNYQRKEL